MTTEQRLEYLRDLAEDYDAAPYQWRSEIRFLLAELDAARARERHALVAGAEVLRRIAAATPVGHEDVTKGPSTYTWLCYAASLLMAEAATTPATPLEQELITLRAREAKLREALMRECWVIEEQDKETEEWETVEVHAERGAADDSVRRWISGYPHRVVRYVPADTVAQVGWQPIETATKDDGWLIVYVPQARLVTKAVWDVFNHRWEDVGGFRLDATHWMPLPAPPQEDRES